VKISFFELRQDINSGSYRIWVRDLSQTLNECGHKSTILKNNCTVEDIDQDVIILGKSAYKNAQEAKSFFKNSKIGAINIPADYYDDNIDFVIVGSPEEMCSISSYEHVFMYPLIERQFEKVSPKIHKQEDKIRICFHGHYPHLAKFEPFLRQAIEKISHDIPVEVVIITGNTEFKWDLGRPECEKIEIHKYDINTVSEIIHSCDIGVVPNVSDMRTFIPAVEQVTSTDYGLYNTDYFLRFKNKTNGGRAYVFYQHGLPVIHDLSPSSFEFMSKSGRYIVAHDELSWEKEIRKLYNHNIRNIIAKENYYTFNKYYNPHEHAEKLVDFIRETNE